MRRRPLRDCWPWVGLSSPISSFILKGVRELATCSLFDSNASSTHIVDFPAPLAPIKPSRESKLTSMLTPFSRIFSLV